MSTETPVAKPPVKADPKPPAPVMPPLAQDTDVVTIRVQLTEAQVEAQFAALLERFGDQVHALAVKNGFWENPNFGEKVALVHSELSEGLEAARKDFNSPDDKIPDYTGVEAELSDALIRILDLAKYYKIRLGEALLAKHKYNKGRPFKHGKRF